MSIPVLLIAKYLLLYIICYSLFWLFFRFILHPQYRWHQKGNICYSDARAFAFKFGLIIFTILVLLINNKINFVLE